MAVAEATVKPRLKDRYRADPSAAWTPLDAEGDYRDDGITCTVDTSGGPVRAGG